MEFNNKVRNESEPSEVIATNLTEKSGKNKSRKVWKIIGATTLSVLVPSSLVALAESRQNGVGGEKVITLDTVSDTVPSATETTSDFSTTTVVDTVSIDTTIPDTTPTTDMVGSSSTNPEITIPTNIGLQASFSVLNGDVRHQSGDIIAYSITVNNPDNIQKNIRVTAGYNQNGAVRSIAGLRVDGCTGWRGGANSIYIGIDNITLEPLQTCTINFDVLTKPDYVGDLKAVCGIYDDTLAVEISKSTRTLYIDSPLVDTTVPSTVAPDTTIS